MKRIIAINIWLLFTMFLICANNETLPVYFDPWLEVADKYSDILVMV